MRSPKGILSAVVLLLAVPAAVVASNASEAAADFAIHAMVGMGSILLALAVFDFAMPRWLTWLGAASAGAFGTIFLLQAVSQIIPLDALSYIAFDVLGQEIEGNLPSVVMVWFAGLLLFGSQGKSKLFGLAVVSLVIGVEVASIISPFVGIALDSQKLLFLLPFAWLLVESIKRAEHGATVPTIRAIAESPAI